MRSTHLDSSHSSRASIMHMIFLASVSSVALRTHCNLHRYVVCYIIPCQWYTARGNSHTFDMSFCHIMPSLRLLFYSSQHLRVMRGFIWNPKTTLIIQRSLIPIFLPCLASKAFSSSWIMASTSKQSFATRRRQAVNWNTNKPQTQTRRIARTPFTRESTMASTKPSLKTAKPILQQPSSTTSPTETPPPALPPPNSSPPLAKPRTLHPTSPA